MRYFHVTPLPCNENELLTHTLRATCGTLLSNENELLTHTLHSKVRYFHVTPPRPRNITHANPRLLQIAANDQWRECCELLTQFGFRRKMLYLCTSEEERALNKRVFSSFFAPKNGVFTSEVNFFTLLKKFFLGVCGFFLRHVGGFLGDEERVKVKRYLFSWPHFFVFWWGERRKEEGRGIGVTGMYIQQIPPLAHLHRKPYLCSPTNND